MKRKRILALLLAVLIVLATNPVFGFGAKAERDAVAAEETQEAKEWEDGDESILLKDVNPSDALEEVGVSRDYLMEERKEERPATVEGEVQADDPEDAGSNIDAVTEAAVEVKAGSDIPESPSEAGYRNTNAPDGGASGTKDYVRRLVRDGNTVLFAHYDKNGNFYHSNPELSVNVEGKTYTINTVCVRFDWSPGLDDWEFDVDKTEITDATVKQLIYHAVDKLEYSMAHRLLCYWLGKRGTVNGINFAAANQNVKIGGDPMTDQSATGYNGMSVKSFIDTYTSDAEAIPENIEFHTFYLEHDTTYEPSSAEWACFQDFISWTKEEKTLVSNARNYYVAFRKVDGLDQAVNDIQFSMEVTGVRVGEDEASTYIYTPEKVTGKKDGFPATGWYFDVTGNSSARRWPSLSEGDTAAKAHPVYRDSDGKQQEVPDGIAIVFLGSFEKAPTSVLIQEKMTEAQKKQYLAKYTGAYDLAKHGYLYTSIEDAILHASDADITWRNYEKNYVTLTKAPSDPAYVEGKSYYSLEGAEYKLYKYEAQAKKALEARASGKPDYKNAVGTFVVKKDGTTDAIDVTKLMEKDLETGKLVEEGTRFYVIESLAPKNYHLSEEVTPVLVKPENTEKDPAVFKVEDVPVIFHGDIEVTKLYDRTDLPLEGAVFEIRNLETDEVRTIVTDAEGHASTAEPGNAEGTLPMGPYRVTELDAQGCQKEEPVIIWVGWVPVKSAEGVIEWQMPEDGPVNGVTYQAYDPERKDGRTEITDMRLPELGTIAMSVDPMQLESVRRAVSGEAEDLTGEVSDEIKAELSKERKTLPAEPGQRVYDLCLFRGLRCDTDYTLVGTLMLVEEDGSVVPFTRADGSIVSSKSDVIHTKDSYERSRYEAEGIAIVCFDDLNFTEYQGRQFVVYERLYLGTVTEGDGVLMRYPDSNNETTFPLIHEDPKDRDQTVEVETLPPPGIFGTRASVTRMEELSETHQRIHVTDSVFYQNLPMRDGISYTIKGTLMNMDGTEALIDGRVISSEVEFIPAEADGTVEVVFPGFEFALAEGAEQADFSYVVYEELYQNKVDQVSGEISRKLIGEHKDPGATEQTVTGHLERTTEQPVEDDTSVHREPEKPEETTTYHRAPQTGDGTPLTILAIVMGVAALGTLILIRIKNKKK